MLCECKVKFYYLSSFFFFLKKLIFIVISRLISYYRHKVILLYLSPLSCPINFFSCCKTSRFNGALYLLCFFRYLLINLSLHSTLRPPLLFSGSLHAVPPIVLFLTNHPMVAKYDISHLKVVMSAAAPLTVDATKLFESKFPGKRIKQASEHELLLLNTLYIIVYVSVIIYIYNMYYMFVYLYHVNFFYAK